MKGNIQQTSEARMTIETYYPTGELQAYIKQYMVISCREDIINRVLPGTSTVMAFRYKGHVSYLTNNSKEGLLPFVISGLRKTQRLINYSKNTGNILVMFKDMGAQAFIKEPLYGLYENSFPLNLIDGYTNLSNVEEMLATAESSKQRIRIIERFLLSKLRVIKPDPLVLFGVEKILASNGRIRIRELASDLNISLDPLEKRFKRSIGISPKQYSYVIRMKSVVDRGIKNPSFAAAAYEAGYFDQPHFIRDFKLFTGQTPTDFLKNPAVW